ncbi:serine/threonine-protein kinase [Corallococcus silvisoli]|uniref:serine/threonine-protein kinase n=1 Tax=Corallococcus silvisoli TaxID=2697031 RepID=UPI001377B838|nr:serine/threonine-protein kinase [Corallococcus silvisoli]NBD08090.1 protein kinase [Corallococcus silvisoli]
MALQAGDTFGRYELVSWLGRGGMAETWRAQLVGDAGVTKPVLIKKVLPEYANDEAFISMFISEARISATLSHGNVAQVFDFGRVDGEYFLAMEFVDGQPLHRILKRAMREGMPALPFPVAVFIAMEMCRGLHYAHTRTDGSGTPLGIVHRDISPDNVLVSYEGQVKIVDFGIAKAQLLRGFKTAPGVVKGKYLFFSPEQARGEDVDARTDVWATGVVLYELLCGRLPVEGPPHVVMTRVAHGEVPPPGELRPDLPAALNAIVLKALHPERSQRFESSHAFGEALAEFLYAHHPRFSSLSLAHLLRVMFRDDLTQQGRDLSIPNAFLDEMRSWREPGAALARKPTPSHVRGNTRRSPRAEPGPEADPPDALAPPGSRKLAVGLSTALLTVGAGCFWLLTSTSPPPATHGGGRPMERPPGALQAPPMETWDEAGIAKARWTVTQLQKEQHLEEALQLATRCFNALPQNPDCHWMLASTHALRQNTALAAFHYRAVLSLVPPEDSRRASVTAELRALEGDTSPPVEAASQPSEPSLDELRSRIQELTVQGDLPAALTLAHQCGTRFPREAECQLLLGALYARANDTRTSVNHYQRFLEFAPATHPSRKKVVKILDEADALSSATGRIAQPETFADMMEAGRTAFSNERYPEAATAYRNALAMRPGSADTKLELGLTLIKLQKATPSERKQAVRLLEDVTRQNPSNRRAWVGLETAYTLIGEPAKAKRANDRAQLFIRRNYSSPQKARELLRDF